MSNDEYAKNLIPTFHSSLIINGEEYIEMEDLLRRFERKSKDLLTNDEPWVMDIKMGTRTFLEKEISSSSSRSDLYEKMIKIDAAAVTQEERERKSISKLRYMTFRESLSSSLQLGFRIEGVKVIVNLFTGMNSLLETTVGWLAKLFCCFFFFLLSPSNSRLTWTMRLARSSNWSEKQATLKKCWLFSLIRKKVCDKRCSGGSKKSEQIFWNHSFSLLMRSSAHLCLLYTTDIHSECGW